LSKVAVRIVGVGAVCAFGLCTYFLNKTVRLYEALKGLEGQRSQSIVSKITEERKLIDQGLQKKYSSQLDSFARLAHDLQIEKNKAKKLEEHAQNEVKKP